MSQVLSLIGMFPFHPLFFETVPAIGAALEAIILSLALADKISILKKQQEEERNLLNEKLESLVIERTKKLEEANVELEKLSTTDALTQLYNRYKIESILNVEVETVEQHGALLSVILLDIDHFKQVNDRYGHQVGDQLLITVAQLLKETIHRDQAMVGRWGGEEFIVVCPNMSLDDATKLANRVRETIEHYPFPLIQQKTGSFGVSCYQKGDESSQLVSRADQALYKVKARGRNRVEVQ